MPWMGPAAHASALARTILDQASAARRHVETNVDHLAYLFTPGDLLEFTHGGTSSVRLKCRLVKIAESEDKRVQLAALEHNPTLDALRNSVIGSPPGCIGSDCDEDEDDDGNTDPGTCEESRGGTGSVVAWFNGGAPYAPGTYFVHYLSGAYRLTPTGGYAVEGYDLVTRDADGTIRVLAPAPAVSNPTTGFATDTAAEDANDGESLELALPQIMNVGLRLRSGERRTVLQFLVRLIVPFFEREPPDRDGRLCSLFLGFS